MTFDFVIYYMSAREFFVCKFFMSQDTGSQNNVLRFTGDEVIWLAVWPGVSSLDLPF